MAQVDFPVRKMSDKEVVLLFDALVEEAKPEFTVLKADVSALGFNSGWEIKGQEWRKDKTVQRLIEQDMGLLSRVILTLSGNVPFRCIWQRVTTSPLQDGFQVHAEDDGSQPTKDKIIALMIVARKVLEPYTVAVANVTGIGEQLERHYSWREQALATQEQRMSSFFQEMERYTGKLLSEQQQKLADLEERNVARQKAMDEDFNARLAELAGREAKLNERIAAYDTKESKGHRRQLRQNIKTELKDMLGGFELSPTVRKLRWPVHIATVGAIAGLAVATGYLFNQSVRSDQGTFDYLLIGRQILLSVTTVGFVTFYIGWSNKWFHRNADEEFMYKRLSVDIDRASWLVETVIEWYEENQDRQGTQFPEQLLRELAKGLFEAHGLSDGDYHPANVLAGSLLGAAAKIKLSGGGTEVEFDRKGLSQIAKTAAKD